MLILVRAELRESWSAWLGVILGFLATSFSFTLAALVTASGLAASDTAMPAQIAQQYWSVAAFNLVVAVFVGLTVVGTATALVVNSRRGAIARLALAGAGPGQITRTMMGQLAAVALASALAGNALGVLGLQPTLDFLRAERGAEAAGFVVPPLVEPSVLIGIDLLWLVVVLLGGWREARRANRIPPVEALRAAQGLDGRRPPLIGRLVRAAIALIALAAMFVAIRPIAAERGSETFTMLLQLTMLVLVVTGWLLAELMPQLVGPLTRAWTTLVPTRNPEWFVARATVLARSARLAGSVTPVMFTMGLTLGILGLGGTVNRILAAAGTGVVLDYVGGMSFLKLLGLALLIALAGSVGSLIMMSRQREAELALLGIAGATPAQRLRTPLLEGVIVVLSATLCGLVMVAVCFGYLATAMWAIHWPFVPELPLASGVVALLCAGGITVAATVLPTRRTASLPEPRVIARLVAE